MTPKIGIATDPSGTAFIFPNDYYGACLNIASKLGEDHAEAGQVSSDLQTISRGFLTPSIAT